MAGRTRSSRGPIAIDRRDPAPVYRQIYNRVRAGIAAGTLRPGDRLPSARVLAIELGTARGTVDAAYALLQGEGYIVSRRPTGTIVSPELTAQNVARVLLETRSSGSGALVGSRSDLTAPRVPLLFRMGVPAFDAFPRKLWSRLAIRRARALDAQGMAYPDPQGHASLRHAIANYLAVSRGVVCAPSQILVTNGYQDALDLIMRVLLNRGDQVLFEDPGYPLARDALIAGGMKLVPVPVDAEGLRVADGLVRAPRARLAVVTPSQQSPLGIALSLPRRLALLSWARAAGAWIVEDDYDSELRYMGRPLPALKSLDRDRRVLYAGSFSKVLFPGLRLGYLAVPEALTAAFVHASRLRHDGTPAFLQCVVADFVAEGHFARHLKRMRGLYAARRNTLAAALDAVFGDRIAIDAAPGGMHLIARLGGGVRDVELADRAQAGGFAVEALSRRSLGPPAGNGLLLGFTNIAETDALATCRRLERVIGKELTDGSTNRTDRRPGRQR